MKNKNKGNINRLIIVYEFFTNNLIQLFLPSVPVLCITFSVLPLIHNSLSPNRGVFPSFSIQISPQPLWADTILNNPVCHKYFGLGIMYCTYLSYSDFFSWTIFFKFLEPSTGERGFVCVGGVSAGVKTEVEVEIEVGVVESNWKPSILGFLGKGSHETRSGSSTSLDTHKILKPRSLCSTTHWRCLTPFYKPETDPKKTRHHVGIK